METIYPTGTEPSVGVSALVALEATLPLKTASTFAEKKGNEGDYMRFSVRIDLASMDREVKVLMNPVMYADTRQYAYKKKLYQRGRR